jgi:hypothetical protein
MGRLQIRDTSDGINTVKGEIMEILNAWFFKRSYQNNW